MSDYRRMICDVGMNALVFCSEYGALIAGHTYTVGNHFYEDFIVFNGRKFKRIET